MARRFITAEDVRRADSGELIVDAETVVTPQALEAAAAAGVVLRHAGGEAYVEPEPDRGPDAARAERSSPYLPEPSGSSSGDTGVVVTVVGRNRPGVLSEVTAGLAQAGADVRDIAQKTVQDYFHLVLTVALEPNAAFDTFKQHMECLGGQDDYVVRVMHERVFRFMHRI
jgi:predicted amino acid-binding ACT domain protein